LSKAKEGKKKKEKKEKKENYYYFLVHRFFLFPLRRCLAPARTLLAADRALDGAGQLGLGGVSWRLGLCLTFGGSGLLLLLILLLLLLLILLLLLLPLILLWLVLLLLLMMMLLLLLLLLKLQLLGFRSDGARAPAARCQRPRAVVILLGGGRRGRRSRWLCCRFALRLGRGGLALCGGTAFPLGTAVSSCPSLNKRRKRRMKGK
jgi:hypothetical protein